MSDPKHIFQAAIDAAESGPFDYLIYGGIAAGIWGEPRYTEDVDLVLFLPERDIYKYLRAASKFGFAVDEDLAIQQIQVNGWARLPLEERESPWHLDITLGDSPFDESALQRRRRMTVFHREVWLASPEDVIVYKLVSARPRDLDDVREIVKTAKPDRAYVELWVEWWEGQGVEGIRQRWHGM